MQCTSAATLCFSAPHTHPLHLFPTGLHSLLTSSLVLLLLVGARGKKEDEMGVCECVRHKGVVGGEWSGVTGWSCRTHIHRVWCCSTGKAKVQFPGAGEAVSLSLVLTLCVA